MSKLNLSAIILLLFCLLSSVFYASVKQKEAAVIKLKTVEIEKQVALDLPLLNLSNTFLKHSGDRNVVKSYIKKMNQHLANEYLQLVDIAPKNELSVTLKNNQFIRSLIVKNEEVLLILAIKKPDTVFSTFLIFGFCLLLSTSLGIWLKAIYTKNNVHVDINSTELVPSKVPLTLVIDLNNKTLSNNYEGEKLTSVANKPLCFYLALVEFCKEHSDVTLNQNKDIPNELTELANKYFYRLIELGHTIRKRPNFNSSLEKTLSEIRAALDDVFSEHPEQKELYYPPKAYGEGSRSRLHSYGLVNIGKGNIEIKGK